MSILRILTLLALSCAMDLVAPVAPVAAAIQFDDDEDLLHLRRSDAGKRPTEHRRRQEGDRDLRPRVRLTLPRPREIRADWLILRDRAHLAAADRVAAPARSPEDH
jgi:hypothetical protein